MSSVTIRMFRQGLGDSFLLSFPGQTRASHVLIDFGVLLGTADAAERMRALAREIVKTTGGELDVLVATHEHWDHVSGFAQAEAELGPDKLKVGEVWLAWTEKPDDPLAMELDKRRSRALKAVATTTQKLAGLTVDAGAQRTARRMSNVLEFWGGFEAAGRRTTRTALDWVRRRTEPKPPKYLEPGMAAFDVPGCDEVRVYVLGPPRDPKLLKRSDPSKRASEVYELGSAADADFGFLAAVEANAGDGPPAAQPFDDWFRVSEEDAKTREFFKTHYGFEGDDWQRIENDWLGLAGQLALQLDSDTNNTSLVLAFESKKTGRVLLFPGDAQVGNWLSWHEGIAWQIPEGASTRTVKAADLLARTVLYKVGHHGSHNATLREKGLELMTSEDLFAMLPVDRPTAKKMEWAMPFTSLFERLQERTKGRILDLERGLSSTAPAGISQTGWDRFVAQTQVTKDWIEVQVEL